MYYTTVQSHYILPLHGIGLVSNNSYPVFISQGEPWREKEIKKVSLRGGCGGKGSGAFSNICCSIPTQKLLEVIVPFLELVMQFCLIYKAFSTLARRLLHSKSAFLDDCLWHPPPPPSPLLGGEFWFGQRWVMPGTCFLALCLQEHIQLVITLLQQWPDEEWGLLISFLRPLGILSVSQRSPGLGTEQWNVCWMNEWWRGKLRLHRVILAYYLR